jgi:AraC-like DNA-binding protein
MTNLKCILCLVEITDDNDSREHIIANAIGGRKRVSGLLCKPCNDTAGDSWDAELARQLQPLSSFFGIKRQRGALPTQIVTAVSGNQYARRPDGQLTLAEPVYQEIKTGTETRIVISARTPKEARQLLNRAKAQYPQLDVDALAAQIHYSHDYLDDIFKMDLNFGGEKSGRSIVKSCAALAVHFGLKATDCDNAMEYLTNLQGFPCFGYFHEHDLIRNRPNEVFHCVAVSGDSQSGLLIGYAEYFGVYRIVVGMSDRYTGKNFKTVYAVNPISGKQIKGLDIELALTKADIQDTYEYKKIPDGSMAEGASKVIPIGL